MNVAYIESHSCIWIGLYAGEGTLRQFLVSNKETITMDKKKELVSNIASGIKAVHDCAIIHGDVKMENILMVSRRLENVPQPKIADFGSSIIVSGNKHTYTYWGTAEYNAPEIRQHEDRQDYGCEIPSEDLIACDIYALGLLISEAVFDGAIYVNDEIKSLAMTKQFESISEAVLSRANAQISELGSSESAKGVQHALQLALTTDVKVRNDMEKILKYLFGDRNNLAQPV